MQALYPKGKAILFQGPTGGSYVGGPFRGVLHTTESKDYTPSVTDYYGHSNPPHFTVAKKGKSVTTYQHYSIKVASRALRNAKGGVQTNRQGAVQIEIAWTAKSIPSLPDDMKNELMSLIDWISQEAGIQKIAPPFYNSHDGYGPGAVSRMSFEEWTTFNGWCGHQHVPENTHWDPGPIDIDHLLAA